MPEPIIVVNEIFGPTLQGEGRSLGIPVMFLRLAGCNLACTWCDTPYSWDWQRYDPRAEMHPMNYEEIISRLEAAPLRLKHLVISGGEPLLQRKALFGLCLKLRNLGWYIEVETAGTISPNNKILADQYNVSPKLFHSGNPEHKRIKPDVLKWFAESGRANFKFVVQNNGDWQEIDEMVAAYQIDPDDVYIMPEGTKTSILAARSSQLINEVIARGYHFTPRLHIALWGKRRGV